MAKSSGKKRKLIIGLLLIDLAVFIISYHGLQEYFDGHRVAAAGSAVGQSNGAVVKEKYDKLYTSTKDWFNAYVQNVLGTLATLLLGIGWILTSKEARNFLRSNSHIIYSALSILEMICLAHIWVSLYAYSIMDFKYDLLNQLHYLNSWYYKDYKLNMVHCIINLLINISLFKLLILMVYSLKFDTETGEDVVAPVA